MRKVGTVSRGIRCPIIREGDDLAKIVVDSIIEASEAEGFEINNQDIIGMTESIVARAQGNYASTDSIASDISSKYKEEVIGIVFPILSRNRFSSILQAVARGAHEKVVIMLNYPSDEVGNALITLDELDASGINPYSDVLNLAEFRKHFPSTHHRFTGLDYITYYQEIVEKEGKEVEIIFSNDARVILDYTKNILTADVHANKRTMKLLEKDAEALYSLADILTYSINGEGYNEEYGLLGANKSTDESVKLFPRNNFEFVQEVQDLMYSKTGKIVEVMVYGDGAFKDPVGQIWELADPTVAPGFTDGLKGTPHEIKLKYLADNEYKDLSGEELAKALEKEIKDKEHSDENASLGTTPRRIVDLVGSLCDLTSGSGDKGTPIVYVQGYFDSYAD